MLTKNVTSSLYLALATALVAGCMNRNPSMGEPRAQWANGGRSCDSTAPARALSTVLRDSLGNPFDTHGTTSRWTRRAAIARRIPGGWGGVTRRKDGAGFAIYLRDTTQRREALDALLKSSVPNVSTDTEARSARWTYGELYDWFRYVHTHLNKVPLTMWSLDQGENRIVYGVETEQNGLELDRQLTALDVPCYLVWREVMGPAHT